jgi:hypothetical protein
MTADKQSGAYKITSVTFTPGPANSVLAQVNFEGTAPGYGTVLGTNMFVVGKSGTYSGCSACYLDNGEISTYTSRGTYESNGHHKWHLQEVGQFSDGQTVAVEAEIDLAARTMITKY